MVQGVLGMSWCQHDANLVLSSGKDCRTICWDVASGQVYCELPPSSHWNFDVQVRQWGYDILLSSYLHCQFGRVFNCEFVGASRPFSVERCLHLLPCHALQWAPGEHAGMFSTAAFEGELAVHTLASCVDETDAFNVATGEPDKHRVVNAAFSKAQGYRCLHTRSSGMPRNSFQEGFSFGGVGVLSFAESLHSMECTLAAPSLAKVRGPSWLKRPCTASLAFGGKLVRVSNSRRQLARGEVADVGTVTMSQASTAPDAVMATRGGGDCGWCASQGLRQSR
jgi:hypothetical protein